MGPPMMPRPMKPTVVMGFLLAGAASRAARAVRCRRCWGGSAGAAALARQPGEAVGAGPAGLVLQPDPAVVAGGGEVGEVVVQVEGAGPRLVAPGSVGDLHVRDPV